MSYDINIKHTVMNRQPTFQERCEAFAACHGRLVDMREDDSPPSSLCSPVASAAVSFDALDDVADDNESGGVGAAGIGDLCVPSTAIGAASMFANPIEAVSHQACSMPSTIIRAASLSANPAHSPLQKAKALPGPKTYKNDAHISLCLSIAEQLCPSGVHLITNAPLRKQGKVNVYQNTCSLPPGACMA